MQKSKNAFTMIEIVFVIVILGILSAIAIPRLAATRDDAEVAKIRADVSSIRSAIISERQSRLIKGEHFYISTLDKNTSVLTYDRDNVALFDGNDSDHTLLRYPIFTSRNTNNPANTPNSGKWLKTGFNIYTVNVGGTLIPFTYYPQQVPAVPLPGDIVYQAGTFDCDRSNPDCIFLLQ